MAKQCHRQSYSGIASSTILNDINEEESVVQLVTEGGTECHGDTLSNNDYIDIIQVAAAMEGKSPSEVTSTMVEQKMTDGSTYESDSSEDILLIIPSSTRAERRHSERSILSDLTMDRILENIDNEDSFNLSASSFAFNLSSSSLGSLNIDTTDDLRATIKTSNKSNTTSTESFQIDNPDDAHLRATIKTSNRSITASAESSQIDNPDDAHLRDTFKISNTTKTSLFESFNIAKEEDIHRRSTAETANTTKTPLFSNCALNERPRNITDCETSLTSSADKQPLFVSKPEGASCKSIFSRAPTLVFSVSIILIIVTLQTSKTFLSIKSITLQRTTSDAIIVPTPPLIMVPIPEETSESKGSSVCTDSESLHYSSLFGRDEEGINSRRPTNKMNGNRYNRGLESKKSDTLSLDLDSQVESKIEPTKRMNQRTWGQPNSGWLSDNNIEWGKHFDSDADFISAVTKQRSLTKATEMTTKIWDFKLLARNDIQKQFARREALASLKKFAQTNSFNQ